MKKDKKELVADILRKNTNGLTIVEIAGILNISRNTAAVALAELKGANLIWIREVGMAKLHYWNVNKKRDDENKK